jgi:phenylglyoxylate dehydrogenase alpha subunit
MAYRLAEDPEVLLPVVVAYDGYYLSHSSERVDIPEQDEVDKFLAPVSRGTRPNFKSETTLHFSPSIDGKPFAEYRYKAMQALERVKSKIVEVEREFYERFGRHYGGMVDTYRDQDAEILILTAGSCAGTARVVIDQMRDQGMKVGLARIRMFRPYPRQEIRRVLDGKKAVAVIDRSICLGWNCGHLFMEARAVLPDMFKPPRMIDFIDGIANADITSDHIEQAIAVTAAALSGKETAETNWLIWE